MAANSLIDLGVILLGDKKIRRAVIKIVARLGFECAKYEIIRAVMKEFISRGLDKVYSEEIKEWEKYTREKKFAIKLDKQMKDEIKRFKKELKKYTTPELEEIFWEVSHPPGLRVKSGLRLALPIEGLD